MNSSELKIISILDDILKDKLIEENICLTLSRAKERFTQSWKVPHILDSVSE